MALSFLLIYIDKRFQLSTHHIFGFFYEVGPEGARLVLSTIANSMITVAGVAFSITIVALTLASSQFGPRMLRNFMKDTGNQVVLGTFISTFIYCLLVIRAVHTSGEQDFVPHLSVSFSLVAALFNVGVLIYFIHHISSSIQAEQVVASVYQELESHIDLFFPDTLDDKQLDRSKEQYANKPLVSSLDLSHLHGYDVCSPHSGYLQAVDEIALLEIAENNDWVIRLPYRAGCFVTIGGCLVTVMSNDKEEISDERCRLVFNTLILGGQRTPEQDVEFTINQLVEIAVRALSPGINDPFTALACIDRLGAALCRLTRRGFPPASVYDDAGNIRLITKPVTFLGIANSAFDQIRQYGVSSVAVSVRLMETLTRIAEQVANKEQYDAVKRQADMIISASDKALSEQNDIADIKQCYQACIDALRPFDDKYRHPHNVY
ncbi:DUF2254 domain-containing protein [Alkalimarinus alittae]|uniref:DUF2254 domain-containing protein n=1 Tax=Alkalimarinus alittae TaxID=2961619 RepID=A0ABY6N3B1_9ALTE|nr:DUF2254 domain-containing protein [Alkalimarinus alittae]